MIYLGRYDKEFDDVKAQYKDGKIMLYHEGNINGRQEIIKVLSLYEIIDEAFYSCTQEEALDIFDHNIDKSYLKDKNNYIYCSDTEKKKILK